MIRNAFRMFLGLALVAGAVWATFESSQAWTLQTSIAAHPVFQSTPDGTAARTTTIYLPSVQNLERSIFLGAYLEPEVSPRYYGTLIDNFERQVRKGHGIYQYYTHWPLGDFHKGHNEIFDEIRARDATPMLTFMSIPATGSDPLGCHSKSWNLDSILDGDHDDYLRTFAGQVAEFETDVLFRWGHEMNLDHYSWSGACNGRNTGKFVRAYRHIVDIFRDEGADNVHWVWSPNYQSYPVEPWNEIQNYYPGDEYVDWIGIVGYNWGASSTYSGREWDTFDMLFRDVLRNVATRYPDKPVMLADVASVEDDGGDKAEWISDAFDRVNNHPNLRAIVWHNYNPPWYDKADFAVDTSTDALRAYRRAIRDERFVADSPY